MQPEHQKMVKILLVRHGETEDNKSKTIAGQRPGKLTELGIKQAEQIGAYLAKEKRQFDYIYVSDLGRTRQTFQNACIKYPYLRKVNTNFSPLIRERSGGIHEGKPLSIWEQSAKKQGKSIRIYKCEGGQSWQDVNARASKLLQQIIKSHIVENKQKKQVKILVVTHGGFIMEFINVMERIYGNPQKFQNTAKNCSMHEFQIRYPEQFYEKFVENKVNAKYTLKNFVGHLGK